MFGQKRKYQQITDEQLVSDMQRGDHMAFNKLYNRYSNRLLYYFYRMLGNSNEKAQDFLQDIFVKIIDNIDKFDTSRKFSTWAFSIAHNMCKNEYRSMEIRKNSPIDDFNETLEYTEELPVVEFANTEDFIRDLFCELENFDEIHKTVFLLHYREGFSLKDIAQTLEISEGTVKSRLFYTRKRLAERLIKYHPNFVNE
jgi:RNA polymerase sigma-70 factor (ECF subfamily)